MEDYKLSMKLSDKRQVIVLIEACRLSSDITNLDFSLMSHPEVRYRISSLSQKQKDIYSDLTSLLSIDFKDEMKGSDINLKAHDKYVEIYNRVESEYLDSKLPIFNETPLSKNEITFIFNKEDSEYVKSALESYSRVGMGQAHYVMDNSYLTNEWLSTANGRRELEITFLTARNIIMPDLSGLGHSYSILSEKIGNESRIAYDIYKVFMNNIHKNTHESEKIPYSVHSFEPHSSSGIKLPEIEIIEIKPEMKI